MKINEIDYASVMPDVTEFPVEEARPMNADSHMDGQVVWAVDKAGYQLFFFKYNESEKMSAYIVVTSGEYNGYHKLERIKNESGPKGSITMLTVFVTSQMGYKLVIDKKEKLTPGGFEWLEKLIANKGRGLKLSDNNGNFPDNEKLKQEWQQAQQTGVNGPTSIFIENKNIQKLPLNEAGFLKPMWRFLGDSEIE